MRARSIVVRDGVGCLDFHVYGVVVNFDLFQILPSVGTSVIGLPVVRGFAHDRVCQKRITRFLGEYACLTVVLTVMSENTTKESFKR